MMQRIEQIPRIFQRVLAQPSADPTLTAVVIGAVALVFLVVVIGLFLTFAPRTRRVVKTIYYEEGDYFDEDEGPAGEPEAVPAEAPPAPPSAASRLPKPLAWLLGPALIPLLVLAAVIGSYAATSTNDYCSRSCHRKTVSLEVAEKVEHARCVECHGEPSLRGVPGNVSDRLRMAVSMAKGGSPEQARAVVGSSPCLRCHDDITEGVLESTSVNILMKHEEPLGAGMTCADCHGMVGHQKGRQPVRMSRCVRCHDGDTASAECNTCHTTDIGRTAKPATSKSVGSGKYSFPPVKISDSGCGGCHNQERECDTCHTLRMPHSEVFISGYHARQAGWEQKERCWRCHVEGDCSKCHVVPFETGHAPGWKQSHKASPQDGGCVCHDKGRDLQPGEMCTYCHGPVPEE